MQYGSNQDTGGVARGFATVWVNDLLGGKLEYEASRKALETQSKAKIQQAKQEADDLKQAGKLFEYKFEGDIGGTPAIYEAIQKTNERANKIRALPYATDVYQAILGRKPASRPEVLQAVQEAEDVRLTYKALENFGKEREKAAEMIARSYATPGAQPMVYQRALNEWLRSAESSFQDGKFVRQIPGFAEFMVRQQSRKEPEDRVIKSLQNKLLPEGGSWRDPSTGDILTERFKEITYDEAIAATENAFRDYNPSQFGFTDAESFKRYKEEFAKTISAKGRTMSRTPAAVGTGGVLPQQVTVVGDGETIQTTYGGAGNFLSSIVQGGRLTARTPLARQLDAKTVTENGRPLTGQVDQTKTFQNGLMFLPVDASGRFTVSINDPNTAYVRAFRSYETAVRAPVRRQDLEDPNTLARYEGFFLETPDGTAVPVQQAAQQGLFGSAAAPNGVVTLLGTTTVYEPVASPSGSDWQQVAAQTRAAGKPSLFDRGVQLSKQEALQILGRGQGEMGRDELVSLYLQKRNPTRSNNAEAESYLVPDLGVEVDPDRTARMYRDGTVLYTVRVSDPQGDERYETRVLQLENVNPSTGAPTFSRPLHIYRHADPSYAAAKRSARIRRVGGSNTSPAATQSPAPARPPSTTPASPNSPRPQKREPIVDIFSDDD